MLNFLCEPYIEFTIMSDISHWQNEYSKDVFWKKKKDVFWFHELNEEKPLLVLTDFLWQVYIEELDKKDLQDPDNHNGVT